MLIKFALASPTSGGSSVGIVRSRTKATELVGYVNLLGENIKTIKKQKP
jgi:hypothetical protein